MHNKTLDICFQSYISGGLSYSEFTRIVMNYIYFSILKKRSLKQEECGEFLLFFYPTIRKIIHRYQEIGKSFEAYLNSHIKFQIKSYFRKLGEQNIQDASIVYQEKVALTNSIVHDSASKDQYAAHHASPLHVLAEIYSQLQEKNSRLCTGFRKRVFIFIIKFINRWTPQQIEFIAQHFLFDSEQIFRIHQLAQMRKTRRITRITHLQELRNSLLQRLHQVQIRNRHTMAIDPDQQEKERRYQLRLDSINKRIQSIPRSLSNNDIAEILSLPKGTVDSSMYLLKKTVKRYILKGADKTHSYL